MALSSLLGMQTPAASTNTSTMFDPNQYLNSQGQFNGWSRGNGINGGSVINWNGMQVTPGLNDWLGTPTGSYTFRKQDASSPTGWAQASYQGDPKTAFDTSSLKWSPYDDSDGFGTKLLQGAALAGAGALLAPVVGSAFSGLGTGAGAGAGAATEGGLSTGAVGGFGDVAGSGLIPGTGTTGLNLAGQAAGSVYGTGAGLGIAPSAIGAASGGTGLGAMIGASIPAASALPGFLGATSTGTLGAGTGIGAGVGAGIPEASTLPGSSSTIPGSTSGLGGLMNGVGSTVGSTVGSNVVQDLLKNLIGGSSGGVSNLNSLASLFTNANQYKQYQDIVDQVKNIYSPDSEYAKYMGNELARKDAAAGRNSQYGPRLAQLMGMLGEKKADALSKLNPYIAGAQGGLNGLFGAGTRLADGSGLTNWITQQLNGGTQGGMLPSTNLGPNAGPQLPDSGWNPVTLDTQSGLNDPSYWENLWGG